MAELMRKEDFLTDLGQRNANNRDVVETVFLPLDAEQRGWQPAPNEWSVDQCFQHLILSFERFAPNTKQALNKADSQGTGTFKSTWLARRIFPWTFNPQSNTKTLKAMNPQIAYSPEVFTRYLAQLDRLSAMIDQAAQADLQTMCWYYKFPPVRFNLGDMLNIFVSHDELHIGQAERTLKVHEEQASVSM